MRVGRRRVDDSERRGYIGVHAVCGAVDLGVRSSTRIIEGRNSELSADRASGAGWDLSVARNRRAEVALLVASDGVVGAFADELAAVITQMSLEVATLHFDRRLSDELKRRA